MNTKAPDWGHVIIWEFHARLGCEARFEEVYGPEGEWAQFFKSGAGYVRTELNRDWKLPRRYVTLDFWTSRAAYVKFREANLAEYGVLEQRSGALTEQEIDLGSFERLPLKR